VPAAITSTKSLRDDAARSQQLDRILHHAVGVSAGVWQANLDHVHHVNLGRGLSQIRCHGSQPLGFLSLLERHHETHHHDLSVSRPGG
jgi:hypothetical protein